jgi:hypothetical protein
MTVELRRYDEIRNWPSNLEFPAYWSNSVVLAQEERALHEIESNIDDITGIQDKNDVPIGEGYWMEKVEPNSMTTVAGLYALRARVEQELHAVAMERKHCSGNPAGCSLKDRWADDYAVRAYLPVKASHLPNYKRLTAQRKTMDVLWQRIASNKAFSQTGPVPPGECNRQSVEYGQCVTDVVEYRRYAKQDPMIVDYMRDESAEARFERWILATNRLRCEPGQVKWGCVEMRGQLDKYRDAIRQSAHPNTGAN